MLLHREVLAVPFRDALRFISDARKLALPRWGGAGGGRGKRGGPESELDFSLRNPDRRGRPLSSRRKSPSPQELQRRGGREVPHASRPRDIVPCRPPP